MSRRTLAQTYWRIDSHAETLYSRRQGLVVKETPVTTGGEFLQRKDFYYDGVRRIQESIYRSDLAPLIGEGGNDEGAIESDPENPGEGNQPPPVMYHWTDREYVYGSEYVDEFVAQFPESGPTLYMVQDANYNVVALPDADRV